MKSLKDTLALAATCAMTLGTAAHGTVLGGGGIGDD